MSFTKELKELNKTIEEFVVFYDALRSFLLDLKALKNDKIDKIFKKYKVYVE